MMRAPATPGVNRRPRRPGMETGLVNPSPVATETITPENTLRTQRILPGASARTAAASGLVNAGVQNVAGINRLPQQDTRRAALSTEFRPAALGAGPRVTPGNDPRLATAQGAQDSAAASVQEGDRGAVQQNAMQRAAAAFGNTAVAGRPAVTPTTSARQAGVAGQVDTARNAVATADPLARERSLRGEYAGALGPSTLAGGPAVTPGTSARTNATASAVDTLRDRAVAADPATERMSQFNDVLGRLAVNPAQGGAKVAPTASARLTGAQTAADQSRAALAETNRRQIAMDSLKAFDLESEPAMQRAQEQALKAAAKGGRLGMGRTEESMLRPLQEMKTSRDALLARLSAELGAGEIEDSFRREGVFSQAENQIAGLEAANRGEERTERDYSTGLEERNLERNRGDRLNAENIGSTYADNDIGRGTALLGQLAGLEGQQFGQDQALQGAARTERDYRDRIDEGNLGRSREDARTALDLAASGADRSVNNDYARAGLLSGEEQRLYGNEANERGELRGERDYATGVDERNIGRNMDVARTSLGYGSSEADADLSGRLAKFGAARDNAAQIEGTGREDRAELRAERGDERGVAEGNLLRDMDSQRYAADRAAQDTGASIDDEFRRTGLFQDLENTSNARDIQQQESMRGERAYEDYLAQDAQSDAERRRTMEEDFYDRDFNRSLQQASFGYGDDPSGDYLNAAGQYGAEAEGAFGDVASLMQSGMYRDVMAQQAAAQQAAAQQRPQQQAPILDNGTDESGETFLNGIDWESLFKLPGGRSPYQF